MLHTTEALIYIYINRNSPTRSERKMNKNRLGTERVNRSALSAFKPSHHQVALFFFHLSVCLLSGSESSRDGSATNDGRTKGRISQCNSDDDG